MTRIVRSFSIKTPLEFKSKLFVWAKTFETAVWLDSNYYKQKYSSFDFALAVSPYTSINLSYHKAFDRLKEYQYTIRDYIFGYISYDLKNDTEKLNSQNIDNLNFPDLFFFQPKKLIFVKASKVWFYYLNSVANELENDYRAIVNSNLPLGKTKNKIKLNNKRTAIKSRISKEQYCSKILKVLSHIYKGEVYELNFCQEFYVDNVFIDPYKTYSYLNTISKPPFAAFFRNKNQYLLSASPERFLRKQGDKIISQPIKGTAKREANLADDYRAALDLSCDKKEQSENIMIVDLVRNDLAKTAKKGSIAVEELCKVYSFKQVHQMVSTISSEVGISTHPVDIIRSVFPMGSMTGAPKIAALKIIEQLEESKRGLYSGSLGYFTPQGNFDFSVVIRSILYNNSNKYLSFSVGGAITAKSIPEKEYQECLLKAKAIKQALQAYFD
ncbi:MAG: anthranilate synthase component I family protein [Tenacibaculum sp.]